VLPRSHDDKVIIIIIRRRRRRRRRKEEKQLSLDTRKGNIRSSRKLNTPKAEEGYCN